MTWTFTQMFGLVLVSGGLAFTLGWAILIIVSRHDAPAPPPPAPPVLVQCGLCGRRTPAKAGDDLCQRCRNRCDLAVKHLTEATREGTP